MMAVVQFGFAMIPWCLNASSGLISGITSGTVSTMRNALELSIITQPESTQAFANASDVEPPALKRA